MSETPPKHIVDLAVEVSGWSPCRSKRGVVIFDGANGSVISHGYNYKPRGFDCDGSAACKATCRREAVHAEQQALLSAGRRHSVDCADMLHVKTVDGELVASGGPSCVQCSKLALIAGIHGVWLFHAHGWQRYPIEEFHRLSMAPSSPLVDPAALPQEHTMDKKATGLYEKFKVERTDGSSAPGGKHDGCAYFVLDLTHDPHAIPAIRAYAESCAADYPLLARDLRAIDPLRAALPREPREDEPLAVKRAREAVGVLRDAVREGRVMGFRERDPLVITIHCALDLAAQLSVSSSAPPPLIELVMCSLKDPDWVCHRRRLDCEHEMPHLMAQCGAFQPVSSSVSLIQKDEEKDQGLLGNTAGADSLEPAPRRED